MMTPSSFRRILKPLALAIQIGIFAGSTIFTSQAVYANDSVTRNYQIPAGSLSDALVEFSLQANTSLTVDHNKLQGLKSTGLSDQYTVDSGFVKLLENTPYAIQRNGNIYVLVEKQKAQQTIIRNMGQLNQIDINTEADPNSVQLPTIVVTADNGANTEHSRSLTSNQATVFKGTTNLKDIPQPVTVLTREYLDQRGLLDLHAVMQNTPGVTVDYTDSERVGYYSRGHQIDALQIDGLTMNQSGSVFVQPDTAILDRIEVLRGASGMLRGSGNPSATVNMTRKRPTQDFQGSVGVTLGSWDRKRVEGDISLPLNKEGSIRARVVAVIDDKDFFQKVREEKKEVYYGVISADLTDKTLATLSFQHTDLDATGSWGSLPANFDGSSLNLPRDTFLGAAWNQWNRYNQQTYLGLEHTFDNDWKLTFDASHTRLRMKKNGGYGFIQSYFSRPTTEKTNPYLFDVTTSVYTGDKSDQNDMNLSAYGKYQLFGKQHEAILGAEYRQVESEGTRGFGSLNRVSNIDIRTWDPYTSYPLIIPTGTPNPGNNNTTTQKAVYARTSLSITEPLNLILGSRLNWWEYKQENSSTSNYKVSHEFTPFVGLTYDLSPEISAYASYTDIFTPQRAYDATGKLLDPVIGQDYELGLKAGWLDNRLNTSFSLFRIDNDGKAMDDPNSPNPCLPNYTSSFCKIAGGLTRSQGWEAEISGQINENWQVMASYTNTQTKYIRDTSSTNIGQPLRSMDPRHLANIFTSYKFNAGPLNGLILGGGLQARSDTYVTSSNITAKQGGYAIYNAMLGYDVTKNISTQLNFNNIFDKVYYSKYAPTGIGNYYGDPRNINFSVRVKF